MDNSIPIFHSLAVIEERIREKLTVEKLAEDVHFSRYHYQRLFRETVGDSVMRYVVRRKLSLAAEELAQTDTSVLDIALRYGYESHEGFCRSFKAFLGVTPMEYRRYYSALGAPVMREERCAMIYSRTTDEILRELNGLIVQARETAAYTEKKVKAADGAADVYALFWERIAARADALADELSQTLERITAIARQPDEITFRFQIIKAIEDAAFQAHITVFQTKLMLSRAKPEHRAAYGPLCERYSALAQSAGIRAGTIAGFFSELAELIFQDMRKNARQALDDAIDKGRRALGILREDTALPYAYIAEEVGALTDEISALALEEVTVGRLENDLLRLDMVLFAADMDVLRAPSHEPLFRGIADFREQLARAMEIFQKLAWDAPQAQTEEEESRETRRKKYSDLALQESILLFSLKGEIQKLDGCLTQEQKAAADVICDSMKRVIGLAEHAADREVAGEIAGVLGEACARMDGLADSLGPYGEPLRFLAGEAAGPAKYL